MEPKLILGLIIVAAYVLLPAILGGAKDENPPKLARVRTEDGLTVVAWVDPCHEIGDIITVSPNRAIYTYGSNYRGWGEDPEERIGLRKGEIIAFISEQ